MISTRLFSRLGRLSTCSCRSTAVRSSFQLINQRYYFASSIAKQKKQAESSSVSPDRIDILKNYNSTELQKNGSEEQNNVNLDEIEEAYEEEEEELSMDLSDLPQRWEKMKAEEQQDILEYLNAKQLFAWNYLSKDDKRAIYFISYGPWGPRLNSTDSFDDKSDPKSKKKEIPLTTPEFIFRLISTSILFGLVGFSMINYVRDKEVIQKIEELEKRQEELNKK